MGKYEEALERAKKAVKDGMVSQSFVDDIFGTQERTDERITNCIVELLRKAPLSYFFDMGTTFVECFAHIEKLKEQQPAEGTELQKAFVNSKIDYTLEEKCDASDYAEAILPTSVTYGENEEEYKLHKIIEAAFIAGKKKAHQPAEWSEDDEYLLKETIQHLEELIRIDKERHCSVNVPYYQRDIDWLKSIRPHPSWKPSEEQMSDLWMAATMNSFTCRTLKSLYNDLKKL